MSTNERRTELRGVREERLFVKVLESEGSPEKVDKTLSCSTLDVSASGMRLSVSEAVSQGTLLELWIEVKGVTGKFLLTGLVRWCCSHGEEFICGVELIEQGEISDLADWQELFN